MWLLSTCRVAEENTREKLHEHACAIPNNRIYSARRTSDIQPSTKASEVYRSGVSIIYFN